MKASIIIPYHERPFAHEHLVMRVLPQLNPQGKYAFGTDTLLAAKKLVASPDLTTQKIVSGEQSAEALIVYDRAVRPETKNCCLQINVGLKKAEGEVFVLLHQDVAADPFAIEMMIDHVLQNPDDLIYATVFKQGGYGDPYPTYWVGPANENEAWFLIACNRDKLIGLGGVDEDFWEHWGFEDMLMLWWWKQHFNVHYVAWAKAIHLWHQDFDGDFEANRQVYFDKSQEADYWPNKGREWGVPYDG